MSSKTHFRCSSLGKLATEPKAKADKDAGNLSATAKAYLKEFMVYYKYGREKCFSNKYTEKGLAVEDTNISLLSNVRKEFFRKNKKRFHDEFITGEPDILTKEMVIDIKSAYDLSTFTAKEAIEPLYWWQLLGYCRLTGRTKAAIAYTLANTPENLILKEFSNEYYKYGKNEEVSDQRKAEIALNLVYTNEWYDTDYNGKITKRNDYWEVLKNAHFPDSDIEFVEIPAEKRVRFFEVEFTDKDFEKLDRIIDRAVKYIEENWDTV